MKIVLISTLYPNSAQPTRALYNKRHFEAIRALGYEVEVIAPIPWFPGKRNLAARIEMESGITVHHPRYFYTPGFCIHHHWRFYQMAVGRLLKTMAKQALPMHVILGFVYPDAVAMTPVCKKLGLNYSVFVLGSDFRVRTKQKRFADKILRCLHQAERIFCPGNQLKEDMVIAGLHEAKIFSFNNGIEKKVFSYFPQDSEQSREASILFVGNLVDVKAPDRLIEAFAQLIDSESELNKSDSSSLRRIHLNLVGEGALNEKLRKRCRELGIENLVTFHGRQSPDVVASMMNAASCLCLCSRSEGMPNVVLESLACGCPVVAIGVGEVPYLIEAGVNGFTISIKGQTEQALISELSCHLERAIKHTWNRISISQKTVHYSWESAGEIVVKNITDTVRT